MAMTPEERQRMETLETTVKSLLEVRNVPFIEELKRRVVGTSVTEEIAKTNIGDLANVNDSGISNGQVLKYNSGVYEPANDDTA